jgi:hypothetical protein
MLVIIEGPDKVGKSTIIDTVYKDYKKEHFVKPASSFTIETFYEEMANKIKSIKEPTVWDRSYYGEVVYARVYGRQPKVNDLFLSSIQTVEREFNVKKILMYDEDVEAHWQRCIDYNEPVSREQFELANSLYKDLERWEFQLKTFTDFEVENGIKK